MRETIVTSSDADEALREERQDWDRVAEAWARWWPTLEGAFRPLTDRLLDLAQVGAGRRVLDVATGIGEPALTAAARVGPGGRVVATDLSPGMLAVARERAAAAGLGNVEFQVAEAESLDGVGGAFDAVLCRLGFMLFTDPGRAAARMAGCLVAGGRLALAVWGPAERAPFLSAGQRAVRELLGTPPPSAGEPGPFRFGDGASLEAVLRGAGLAQVRREAVTVVVEFESPGRYAEFAQQVSHSLRALAASQPPAKLAAIGEALRAAARRHAGGDGRVRFVNEALCAVAVRLGGAAGAGRGEGGPHRQSPRPAGAG